MAKGKGERTIRCNRSHYVSFAILTLNRFFQNNRLSNMQQDFSGAIPNITDCFLSNPMFYSFSISLFLWLFSSLCKSPLRYISSLPLLCCILSPFHFLPTSQLATPWVLG